MHGAELVPSSVPGVFFRIQPRMFFVAAAFAPFDNSTNHSTATEDLTPGVALRPAIHALFN